MFGVNASFEAVGKAETIEMALWCRDLAGRCVVMGVAGRELSHELPVAQFFDVGGSLRISWCGD